MATTETEESFLKAWEAHDSCPSPISTEDPWGSTAPRGEAGSNRSGSGLPSTTAIESSGLSPSNSRHLNFVFQSSSRNNSESAITTMNKNNNSNMRAADEADGSRCFDDDFGAWSETDVIFKSGLLDKEFKTVSVTAEEDDLWSSADLSPLSLSVISEDDKIGESGDPGDGKGTFQECVVIAPSEAGPKPKGDSPIGLSPAKRNCNIANEPPGCCNNFGTCSRNSSSVETVPNDHGDGEFVFVEDDRQGIGIESMLDVENNRAMTSDTTHHSGTISTAVVSNTFNSGQLRYGSAGAVGQSENTSINLTPGIVVSSQEAALSADARSGTSVRASTGRNGNSAVSQSGASSDSQTNIPSIAINSGTFRGGTHQGIMGNVLDSDKEGETMEGEEAITQDKSEQMPSADSGKMNGETPAHDMEETVVLNADGSEVGVNGENGEKRLNISLDTQTQTREEEFPPDDVTGGGVGDQPRENGTLDEEGKEGDQGETNGEDKTVASEEEGPSQSPVKPLRVEENGQEEPTVASSEKESPPRGEEASTPTIEETGLKPLSSREPGDSYVKSAVKLREKKGSSRVNSHVVKQNRISFVEQEVLRSKQQEEEYRRERELREQELRQHKPPVPTPATRLQSPTSPEPPTAKPAPAKPVHRPANSKAKAVYQELNYNPKTGGGNRSTAMVKDWESKFTK